MANGLGMCTYATKKSGVVDMTTGLPVFARSALRANRQGRRMRGPVVHPLPCGPGLETRYPRRVRAALSLRALEQMVILSLFTLAPLASQHSSAVQLDGWTSRARHESRFTSGVARKVGRPDESC